MLVSLGSFTMSLSERNSKLLFCLYNYSFEKKRLMPLGIVGQLRWFSYKEFGKERVSYFDFLYSHTLLTWRLGASVLHYSLSLGKRG